MKHGPQSDLSSSDLKKRKLPNEANREGTTKCSTIKLDQLPPEDFQHIASFLPMKDAIQASGASQNLQFLVRDNLHAEMKKMESSKLLDLCKKNIWCAQKLITTDLAQQFSLDELLSVIGSHELLVEFILNAPMILEGLTIHQKKCIAAESSGTPIILNRIQEYNIGDLISINRNNLILSKLLLRCLEQCRLRMTGEHGGTSEIDENLLSGEDLAENIIQGISQDFNQLSKVVTNVIDLGQNHLEIARWILNSPWYIKKISNEQLVNLIDKHEEIALEVVSNKLLSEKLNIESIIDFAKKYLSVARWCLSQPLPSQELSSNINNTLLQIGIRHAEIAHKILDNPDLYRRFNRDELWGLSIYHTKHPRFEEICLEMLPKRLGSIRKEDLKMIISNQPRILKKIMDEQNLLRRLNADNLTLLGIHDLAMAKKIINTPELLNKIDDKKLSQLGIKWEEIANEIIEEPMLLERLVLPDSKTTFPKHKNGENEYADDDEDQDYIVSYLVDMVAQHEKLARKFLSTPQYLNLLNSEHDLYHIAVTQEAMASIILMDPNLTEKVDMVTLGDWHAKTALLILSNPKLLGRMQMTDVAHLNFYAKNTQEVCEKILSSQELLKLFQDNYAKNPDMFNFLKKSSPSLRMIHLIQKNLKWFPASFHDSNKKASMDQQKEVYEKIRVLLLDKALEASETPMGIKRPRVSH